MEVNLHCKPPRSKSASKQNSTWENFVFFNTMLSTHILIYCTFQMRNQRTTSTSKWDATIKMTLIGSKWSKHLSNYKMIRLISYKYIILMFCKCTELYNSRLAYIFFVLETPPFYLAFNMCSINLIWFLRDYNI